MATRSQTFEIVVPPGVTPGDADLGWAAGTLPSQTFFLVSVLDVGARCSLREVGDACAPNNRPAEAI